MPSPAESPSGPLRPAAVTVLRAAEVGLSTSRRVTGAALDRVELRLRAWRAALDPETRRWIGQTRDEVADGEVERRIEEQPEPSELLDRYRQQRLGT